MERLKFTREFKLKAVKPVTERVLGRLGGDPQNRRKVGFLDRDFNDGSYFHI